jgi:hypothetical protein
VNSHKNARYKGVCKFRGVNKDELPCGSPCKAEYCYRCKETIERYRKQCTKNIRRDLIVFLRERLLNQRALDAYMERQRRWAEKRKAAK